MSVVAELFAKLGLDVDAASFAAADAALSVLDNGFKALGATVAAAGVALAAMVKTTADQGRELNELSARTGVATDVLQEFGYGAQFSGVSLDELAIAMGHLAKTGVKDLRGETMRLAQQFDGMKDGGAKTEIAMTKFGRAGARLIPFLNELSQKSGEWRGELDAMGGIMPPEMIEQGKAFDDSLLKLKSSLTAVRNSVAGPLLKSWTEAIDTARKWVATNRVLVSQRLDKVFTAVGAVLKVLWVVIKGVSSALGLMIDNWQITLVLIGSVIAAIGILDLAWISAGASAVAAAVAAIGAWLAAAAPVLLVAAALALVIIAIQDVYTWLNGGDSIIGRWVKTWKVQTDTVKAFFEDMLGSMRLALDLFLADTIDKLEKKFNLPEFLRGGSAEIAHALTGSIPILGGADITGTAARLATIQGQAGPNTPVLGPDDAAGSVATLTANINVHATGGDPKAVAGAIQDQLDDWWHSKARAAIEGVR